MLLIIMEKTKDHPLLYHILRWQMATFSTFHFIPILSIHFLSLFLFFPLFSYGQSLILF